MMIDTEVCIEALRSENAMLRERIRELEQENLIAESNVTDLVAVLDSIRHRINRALT